MMCLPRPALVNWRKSNASSSTLSSIIRIRRSVFMERMVISGKSRLKLKRRANGTLSFHPSHKLHWPLAFPLLTSFLHVIHWDHKHHEHSHRTQSSLWISPTILKRLEEGEEIAITRRGKLIGTLSFQQSWVISIPSSGPIFPNAWKRSTFKGQTDASSWSLRILKQRENVER